MYVQKKVLLWRTSHTIQSEFYIIIIFESVIIIDKSSPTTMQRNYHSSFLHNFLLFSLLGETDKGNASGVRWRSPTFSFFHFSFFLSQAQVLGVAWGAVAYPAKDAWCTPLHLPKHLILRTKNAHSRDKAFRLHTFSTYLNFHWNEVQKAFYHFILWTQLLCLECFDILWSDRL